MLGASQDSLTTKELGSVQSCLASWWQNVPLWELPPWSGFPLTPKSQSVCTNKCQAWLNSENNQKNEIGGGAWALPMTSLWEETFTCEAYSFPNRGIMSTQLKNSFLSTECCVFSFYAIFIPNKPLPIPNCTAITLIKKVKKTDIQKPLIVRSTKPSPFPWTYAQLFHSVMYHKQPKQTKDFSFSWPL